MKNLIFGLALILLLLCLQVSCKNKHEGNSSTHFNNSPSSLLNIVTAEHQKYYKEQLLYAYQLIVMLNENIRLKGTVLKKLSEAETDTYENHIKEKINDFESKQIQIFNPNSNIHQLLISFNPNLTYRSLYYKLSKITDEIEEIEESLTTIINTANQELTPQASAILLEENIDTNHNATENRIKFVGYKNIQIQYQNIRFKKISMKNSTIPIKRNDWKKEDKSGFTLN